MRAAPLLAALALLAVPPALATADDVAWFAGLLGAQPSDLPATLPLQRWHTDGAIVVVQDVQAPVAEVAALARASGAGAWTDGSDPAPPRFAGGGVAQGAGVTWSGSALGPDAMGCMAFGAPQPTNLLVPANPASPGGPLHVAFKAALPEGAYSRFATAGMRYAALPAPSLAPTSVGNAFVADADLLVGQGTTGCYKVFSLRLTFGHVLGDGTIRGP